MKYNTVQAVFDIAIRLMDEQNESTGSTNTADTREYAVRTPSLLNSQLDTVYPLSDTYVPPEPGKRAICRKVESMEDDLDIDEYICTQVLPYALAALLVMDTSSGTADFFWQTYIERLHEARNSVPAAIEAVRDEYGGGAGIELGQFGHWPW